MVLNRRHTALGFALLALAACGTPAVQYGYPADYPITEPDGGTDAGAPASATDLPCDVQSLLKTNCQSCHSNPPIAGAPMAMVTWSDMTRKTPSDSTKTVAQQSVKRMNDALLPMPPGNKLSSAEIAILQKWVTAGTPKGACATGTMALESGSQP
jgi:uncharacterized membrane protein